MSETEKNTTKTEQVNEDEKTDLVINIIINNNNLRIPI